MKETPPVFRYVRPLLAMFIILASFGFIYLLALKPIPDQNKEIINIVQGVVLSVIGIVVGYYFGTSKDKSDAEQSTRQPNTTVTQSTTVEDAKP